MTRRALKPCAHPTCPELVRPPASRCPDHERDRDRARGTATERGYDHRWREEARRYKDKRRAEGTDYCDHCGRGEDELDRPLEVDHIDGLGPNGPRGYDPTNYQLLCRPDHQAKTAHQTGAKGAP